MRVLVTGGSGWIGTAVCKQLKDRGDEPVVFDRTTGGDILDAAALYKAMDGCDAVVNLAGMLGTSELFDDQHTAVETNIVGALNVYDVAACSDIPVVQIGTGHRGQLNPYAITKACAEDLGLARARYRGEKINVVRAFHAYGPGQKVGPVRKIVPTFITQALRGEPVEVYGDGSQQIDLVHVDEVAAVICWAIEGPYGAMTEAGTGVATTVLECAETIIAACDSDSRIVHLPMRPGEPEHTRVVAGEGEGVRVTVLAGGEIFASDGGHAWPYRLGETVDWYR